MNEHLLISSDINSSYFLISTIYYYYFNSGECIGIGEAGGTQGNISGKWRLSVAARLCCVPSHQYGIAKNCIPTRQQDLDFNKSLSLYMANVLLGPNAFCRSW